MSCQVVACDIYRQPLTHKGKLQRSHTYKQLLPSAWPPPPCSCHGLCEKNLKRKKRDRKKLGPLADRAHSEAKEGKKLWQQELSKGMDSQDTFQPQMVQSFLAFFWPEIFSQERLSFPIHTPRNFISVAFCL